MDNLKRADFEVGADEVFVEVLHDVLIGQCVHTERVGVVSGKVAIFQVS